MLTILVVALVWGLLIYAFLDCVRTPTAQVRFLPKFGWLLVIVLVGTVLGPALWMVFGKRRATVEEESAGKEPAGWVPPDDNPDFLKSLDRDRDDS
jgi:hypothetical protein